MSEWSHLYNDRKWRRLRQAQLDKQPLCERCMQEGRVTEATVCDHVKPHKGDLGLFWSGPFSSLCKQHHDVKTIMQDGGLNSQGQAYPSWLPKPACDVVLVTGPPGAGKTTYCQAQAKPSDVVIDLDDCFTQVCGTHGHTADRAYLGKALKLRNKLLANLASKRIGKAYVIVSCPTDKERAWWIERLYADPIQINPGKQVCIDRVGKGRASIVNEWFAKAKANEWHSSPVARGHDESGLPTDPRHPWGQAPAPGGV